MADVFLSYAREDSARAEQVAQGLRNAGLDVFWDNEIPPGQTWADFIEQKLTQSKALIVLWSEHSTKSQWVREEARMGRDKGVLIPVMIDASQPPFGFGEVQAANLASWNGEADHPGWKRFVDAVTHFANSEPRPAQQAMAAPPRAAPASLPQPLASSPSAKSGVPVWAWLAGGAVAVLAVLYAIGTLMPGAQQQAANQGGQPVQPAISGQPSQPVQPGGDPQTVILQQLQQAQAAAAQQGFQLVGQPFSGGLAQGQTQNVPAQLYLGYDYRVLGVCDADCGDLDLVLYDSAGREVHRDTTTSNQPVVAVQPAYNDNFTIQVQMYNCVRAPCYYALALYGRPMQ